MEIYITAYASNGIIITAPSTSPCRDTFASSSKNTGTIAQNVPNTANTLHCLNNMKVKPIVLFPQIHLTHYRKTISNTCSESSEAFYYTRAVDLTILMALSTIASKQSKGTQNTMMKTKQLMDYLPTHSNTTVRFHTSDMILNIHSDASYISKANAHSQA
jgi:hypothetical protein